MSVPVSAATTCAGLKAVAVPHAKITLAESVAASDLPAFCKVQATLAPSSDSEIKVEVWLPVAANWSGKFRGVGNGGLGGGATVNPGGLTNALRDGYAAAGNNTGHEGGSNYAIGHPEKIKDFGYRSSHEMTVFAKAMIKAYYASPLTYSVMAESGGGTIAARRATARGLELAYQVARCSRSDPF